LPFSGIGLISSNTKEVRVWSLEILRAATFPTSHHNMAHHEFPEIKGGGSLILAWQVKNKKVLVIGGGEVSLARC
jgi:hypothetical protein